MKHPDALNEVELLVLLAVARLRQPYGVTVQREIEETGNRRLSNRRTCKIRMPTTSTNLSFPNCRRHKHLETRSNTEGFDAPRTVTPPCVNIGNRFLLHWSNT